MGLALMRLGLIIFSIIFSFNFAQKDKIYWNNQSTSVKVDVPIGA